jgi:hypothetical protein
VVGEVVVVFYGLESCWLAEEAEVVDWDGGREDSLYGWSNIDLLDVLYWESEEREELPSSIPRPDRRIGTRDIVSGVIVVVVYSYPRCVLLCEVLVSNGGGIRTSGKGGFGLQLDPFWC